MEASFERWYAQLGDRYMRPYLLFHYVAAVVLCVVAAVTFSIYVEITIAELLRLMGFAIVATLLALIWGTVEVYRRHWRPVQSWIQSGRSQEAAFDAWRAALAFPVGAVRLQGWRAIVVAALPVTAYATYEAELDAASALVVLGAIIVAAVYPVIMHTAALELYLRPVVRDLAEHLGPQASVMRPRLPLRWRLFAIFPLINVVTGVFVGVYSTDGDASLNDLGVDFVLAIAVSFTTSLALVYLVGRTVLGPVEEVTEAARRVRRGDLGARVPLTSRDELAVLATTFNEMTADLQASRQRLVTTREEERRRLRRDMHDGLGPSLASIAVRLESARRLLDREPDAVEPLLAELQRDVRGAVTEVRQLVDGLRPPALDELGLIGALRARAASFGAAGEDGLRVEVQGPDEALRLPAAVEVAAYRIVHEALANVVRHAGAHNCIVRVAMNGDLELEVRDDGCGLPENRTAGVGLSSMRERAAELGGECVVRQLATGGTAVHARLPIPGA